MYRIFVKWVQFKITMKHNTIANLLIMLLLLSTTLTSSAQGWSFTATITSSGPCGGYMPYIAPFNIPYMPTQSYCESIRQTVLSISASQPMYDSQNNYLGLCTVYYECTPCTGSDIAGPGGGSEFGVGEVQVDGLLQGQSFFSPHETKELENWMDDYLIRLNTMGPAILDISEFDFSSIPLTGDEFVDRFYLEQSLAFENNNTSTDEQLTVAAPEEAASPAPVNTSAVATANASDEGFGTTVQLLTTSEEQARRDEWMKMNGLDNPVVIGASNTIDPSGADEPVMSFQEAALREFAGNEIAGSFALKTLDGATKSMTDGLAALAGNDNAGATELGNELLSGKVAINAFQETAKETVTSAVTGFFTKPVLGLVPGAGTVTSVITTGNNIWKTMYGK